MRPLNRTLVRGSAEVFRVELPDDAPPRELSPLPAPAPHVTPKGWDLALSALYERGAPQEVERLGRGRLALVGAGRAVLSAVVAPGRRGRGGRMLRELAAAAGVEVEDLDLGCRVERWTLDVPLGVVVEVTGRAPVGLIRAEKGGRGLYGVPWSHVCGPSPTWGLVVAGEPLLRLDGVPSSWPALAEGARLDGLGATV